MKAHLTNIRKSFGGRLVLNVPEYTLQQGDGRLLVGPNGAGKTTFLRILGGMILPDSGEVALEDEARCSYYEAGFLQFGELTVYEHFSFLENLDGEAFDRQFFDCFGLSRVAHEYVISLSRGWRARLGLALAFARRPSLLLLDEPLDALDSDGKDVFLSCLSSFQEHARGVVCIATHREGAYDGYVQSALSFSVGRPLEEATR